MQQQSEPWAGTLGFGNDAIDAPRETRGSSTSDSFMFFEALLDAAEDAHPSSKRFYERIIEAALLHAQKQRDYGKQHDPFANVRASEDFGIPGWIGCIVRANDKMKRLQKAARQSLDGEDVAMANEAVRDSFLDLAVYALIGLVLFEEISGA